MTLATTKYVFAAVGIGMLIAALAVRSHTASFVSRATRAEGTVTALVGQHSTDNNSISYRPVVRFQAGEQQIVFSSSIASNPPAYSVGERVDVLYLESDPYDAKIDSFRSLWFFPMLLGAMGAIFFAIGGGLIFFPAVEQRADERLVHEGRPIEADFQAVTPNTTISVNGRCPYRVTAQWLDPSTSRVRLFQSHNVWFDPTAYIKDKKIRVFLDMSNPDKYYVDLSFLPKLAS